MDLDVIANDKKMMTAPTTRNEHGDAEIIRDWFHYVTVVLAWWFRLPIPPALPYSRGLNNLKRLSLA